jgi:predicted DNA-binding transcriptional regulator YafY
VKSCAAPVRRAGQRLAKTFKVSPRTIKRDLSALQQGGFPVWARPGPGGGYVVDPKRRCRP